MCIRRHQAYALAPVSLSTRPCRKNGVLRRGEVLGEYLERREVARHRLRPPLGDEEVRRAVVRLAHLAVAAQLEYRSKG